MANEKNLKPFRSVSEAREKGSKGGKASGAARRRRRDQRAMMTAMLKCVPQLDKKAIENLKRLGINGKGSGKNEYSIEMIGMAALMQKVMRGDVKAYRLMLEVMGEDARSQSEAARMDHERELMEEAANEPDTFDNGFLDALNAQTDEGVFADGVDEPSNLDG